MSEDSKEMKVLTGRQEELYQNGGWGQQVSIDNEPSTALFTL